MPVYSITSLTDIGNKFPERGKPFVYNDSGTDYVYAVTMDELNNKLRVYRQSAPTNNGWALLDDANAPSISTTHKAFHWTFNEVRDEIHCFVSRDDGEIDYYEFNVATSLWNAARAVTNLVGSPDQLTTGFQASVTTKPLAATESGAIILAYQTTYRSKGTNYDDVQLATRIGTTWSVGIQLTAQDQRNFQYAKTVRSLQSNNNVHVGWKVPGNGTEEGARTVQNGTVLSTTVTTTTSNRQLVTYDDNYPSAHTTSAGSRRFNYYFKDVNTDIDRVYWTENASGQVTTVVNQSALTGWQLPIGDLYYAGCTESDAGDNSRLVVASVSIRSPDPNYRCWLHRFDGTPWSTPEEDPGIDLSGQFSSGVSPYVVGAAKITYSGNERVAVLLRRGAIPGGLLYTEYEWPSGGTTLLTLTPSATGGADLIRQIQPIKSHSGSGSSALTRHIALTKAHIGVGTSALTRQIRKILQHTAIGTAALNATKVVMLALNHAATGTATLAREIRFTLAHAATGTVALAKSIALTFANAATGTVDLTRQIAKTLAHTAVGSVVFAKTKVFLRTFSHAATGTVTLAKDMAKTFAYTATGTATLTKRIAKTFANAANGAVALTKQVGKFLAHTAVGTSFLQFTKVILRTFTYTATGTVALTKTVGKTFSNTATGTVTLAKDLAKTLAYTAIGTVTLTKHITKQAFAITATGTVTLTRTLVSLLTLAATATGTVTLARQIRKTLSHLATGTVALTRQIGKTFTFGAIGSPALRRQIQVIKQVTATGTANLQKLVSASITRTFTAIGTLVTATLKIPGGVVSAVKTYSRRFLKRVGSMGRRR
jgi:hypothetical protein